MEDTTCDGPDGSPLYALSITYGPSGISWTGEPEDWLREVEYTGKQLATILGFMKYDRKSYKARWTSITRDSNNAASSFAMLSVNPDGEGAADFATPTVSARPELLRAKEEEVFHYSMDLRRSINPVIRNLKHVRSHFKSLPRGCKLDTRRIDEKIDNATLKRFMDE